MPRTRTLGIGAAAAVALAAGLVWALRPAGARGHVVEFYTPPGGSPLSLELFYPANRSAAHPVIVYIPHDADWQDTFTAESRVSQGIGTFNESGYVVAMIHYRNRHVTRFPGPVQDAKAAVRWLRAHAKEYGLLPDQICAFGVSAGGYGACMLATTGPADGFDPPGDGGVSCRVQAAASLAAPADFQHPWSDLVERSQMRPFLGASLAENPEVYRRASPGTYASADDPPVLLLHSPTDKSVPISQSQTFANQLKAAGARVTLEVLPDSAAHIPSQKDFALIFESVTHFFNQQLGR